MIKPVSEQLSDLSIRAKKAEDAVAAAKAEGSAKLHEREAQIKADAARRKASQQQRAAQAKESINETWTGMTTKVQSDIDSLHAKIDYKKYQHDREKAANAADDAEENAVRAIDFALDAIDYAESAVLDAVLARATAEAM